MVESIPSGSLVLITGITGYLASHIADQVLEAGYHVRGTSRSLEKAKSPQAILKERHPGANVEIAVVADLTAEGAFDEALEGVVGVVHVASDLSFDSDPNKVIPGTLAGIRTLLQACAQTPSVVRFVYTSSSTAATAPKPNTKFTIDETSWNEEQVTEAWKPAPYEDKRSWAVYGASKTQGEQEVWKFVKEKKPQFTTNAILPNANFGPLLYPGTQGSTASWILKVYRGDSEFARDIPPQYFVDVRDTARLHLIGLVSPDVESERIFAFAEPYNFHDIFTIIKELYPEWKAPPDHSNNDRDLSIVKGQARALALLQTLGRDGFIGLRQSIKDTIQSTL